MRIFIKDMQKGQEIKQVFALKSKEIKVGKSGNEYLEINTINNKDLIDDKNKHLKAINKTSNLENIKAFVPTDESCFGYSSHGYFDKLPNPLQLELSPRDINYTKKREMFVNPNPQNNTWGLETISGGNYDGELLYNNIMEYSLERISLRDRIIEAAKTFNNELGVDNLDFSYRLIAPYFVYERHGTLRPYNDIDKIDVKNIADSFKFFAKHYKDNFDLTEDYFGIDLHHELYSCGKDRILAALYLIAGDDLLATNSLETILPNRDYRNLYSSVVTALDILNGDTPIERF